MPRWARGDLARTSRNEPQTGLLNAGRGEEPVKHPLAIAAATSVFTDIAGGFPPRTRLAAERREAGSDESERFAESALGPAGS
jgi:hypothetical protein